MINFMINKFFIILFLLITLPVFSGEFEEASRYNDKIFLYLYTPQCGYCIKFDPIYQKLEKTYSGNCKFLKINAETEYGGSLLRGLNAYYVPYVTMINNKKQVRQNITPTCLLNSACVNDAIKKFLY